MKSLLEFVHKLVIRKPKGYRVEDCSGDKVVFSDVTRTIVK